LSSAPPPAPAYLVAGDEPLLVMEACDDIRGRARAAGYTEREVYFVERGFDWQGLLAGSRTLSLFASRRLIEIRLNGMPDAAGSKALLQLVSDPSPEQILLIAVGARLDRKATTAGWIAQIEKQGGVRQVWPIDMSRLPGWIRDRLAARGFRVDGAAAQVIAERVEGNLLAAHQEIEKLALLHPADARDLGATLSAEGLLETVADSARYDVLQLGEAVMRGQKARALKIMAGLRGEGTEATLVLWAVNKDLQWLARAAQLVRQGQSADSAVNAVGVWRPRQAAMKQALGRLKVPQIYGLIEDACRVDRSIKGALRRDPWLELQALVARFAGVPLARAA
jgi:DNA polymerase-3 subunit delta